MSTCQIQAIICEIENEVDFFLNILILRDGSEGLSVDIIVEFIKENLSSKHTV